MNVVQERVPKEQRVQKADLVRVHTGMFLEIFKELARPSDFTYYIHALEAHLPEQILSCPIDIMDASGNGIEQVNQVVKRLKRSVH